MNRNTSTPTNLVVSGLFIMSLAYIIYGGLYPFQFNFSWPKVHLTQLLIRGATHHFQLFDVIQNLLFYIPVGIFGVCFFRLALNKCNYCSLIYILFVSAGLSFGCEILQAFVPNRYPSVLDIFLNITSAVLGSILAFLGFWILKHFPQEQMIFNPVSYNKIIFWLSLLFILLWTSYHLYPFIPSLQPSHLNLNLRYLWNDLEQFPSMNTFYLIRYLAEGIGVSLLFKIVFNKKFNILLFFIFINIVLVLKFLVISRVVSLEAIIALYVVIILTVIFRMSDTILTKPFRKIFF